MTLGLSILIAVLLVADIGLSVYELILRRQIRSKRTAAGGTITQDSDTIGLV